MRFKWICAAAMLAGPAGAASAGTHEVKATMGVSATVVATCRVAPGEASGCAPPAKGEQTAAPTPQPQVTYRYDSKTGTAIETLEF